MSDSLNPAAPIAWTAIVAELDSLVVAWLGNRSQKISKILATADLSEAGIQGAIAQIEGTRVMFVDPVRLVNLAEEMRARLATDIGKPLPARERRMPITFGGTADPGFAAAAVGSSGCLGSVLFCLGSVVVTISVAESIHMR